MHHGESLQINHSNMDFLKFTDDIILPSVPQEDLNTKHLFVRPLNEQDYEKLPLYVANHFSLNHINHLLEVLNNFLSSNTEGNRFDSCSYVIFQ